MISNSEKEKNPQSFLCNTKQGK